MKWWSARSGSDEGDEGVVLVWFALLLIVLLGFASFAVDISHWYLAANRAQKRADAAALAGAVFLPSDPTRALATARAVAGDNSNDDAARVTVSPEVGDQPNRLKVTVTETVDNLFANIFGRPTQNVTRTAVAEYSPPLAMGSPTNQLGNDPESNGTPGSTKFPNLWANIAGPDSPKQNGDAFQASDCSSTADNCAGTNTDYDPSGYYYTVRIAPGSAGPVVLQAFDPAFVAVGDSCGANDDNSNLQGAAQLLPNFNPLYPGTIPPSVRYQPVLDASKPADPGLRWCTGDHIFNASGPAPATTFSVLGPAAIPGDPTSAPPVSGCRKTFPGVQGSPQTPTSPGVDLSTLLTDTNPVNGAPAALVTYFRQWYTICSVNAVSAGGGDYFVQVTTSASAGSGHNRFALRAGFGSCTTCFNTNAIGIFGNARMSIYANVGSNTLTSFNLARLVPGGNGRTLVLNFFDIGDGAGGVTGTLTVVPPADSNTGATFPNCTFTKPPGNATGPPWGTPVSTGSACAITGVNQSDYNGQWIQMRIPVPDGYQCNSNDALGCWVKINYLFTGNINDTTSWSAYVEGDPVRLIK